MISSFRARQSARKTLRLLEQERQAFLTGNLTMLGSISTQLERAADALGDLNHLGDAEAQALVERIRAAASHNQSLAEASRRGLRAGARIRGEAQSGGLTKMQTYTNRGRTQVILGVSAHNSSDRRT